MSTNIDSKKILLVGPYYPPEYAGGSLYIHEIARILKQKYGYEFIAVTKTKRMAFLPKESKNVLDGIAVFRVSMSSFPILGKLLTFLGLVFLMIKLRNTYSAIHFMGIPNEVFLMTLLGRLLGKKMVSTMALTGDDDLRTIADSQLGGIKIRALRAHRKIIGFSDETVSVSRCIDSLVDRLLEIPNALDVKDYSPVSDKKKDQLREIYDLESKTKFFIFTGALGIRKGVDTLLDVIEQNKEYFSENNIKFILVGPVETKSLSSRIEALESQKMIVTTGALPAEEVIPYYQASDYFVFPSTREGFGRVAIEAMAVKLPCVVSNIEPMEQIFDDGVDGLLFKTSDSEDLFTKMKKLIENEEFTESLITNAYNKVHQRYRIEDASEMHHQVYSEL